MALSRERTEPAFARDTVAAAAAQWNIRAPTFVRWFENAVYCGRRDGELVYLRLTEERRRTATHLRSEIALLRFLGECDFPAARTVPSNRGADLLRFESRVDGAVHAVVFTKCPGYSFQDQPPVDLTQFSRRCGHAMGLLHAHLCDFALPSDFDRPHWSADRWPNFEQVVPPTETAAWRLYEQCQLWWAQWGQVDYGLVHGDLTIKNLRYQGDVVSLFDFDGACMHWYGYELACFLHAFRDYPVLEQQRIAEALLAGYAQARPLPSAMPIQLPEFVQMKRLRSFLVLAHEWDFAALTPAQTKIVAHRRDQLIAGTVTVA